MMEPDRPSESTAPNVAPVPKAAVPHGDYDANGVDLSLIRYVLQLAPVDRLRLMERRARETQVLNELGRRHFHFNL